LLAVIISGELRRRQARWPVAAHCAPEA
jgi:hypothetical protein